MIGENLPAAPEKDFPERMFIYAIRIFEYFHQVPVSLAILCDGKASWRPPRYANWAMILPEGLKWAFWVELQTSEEEGQMPDVTSVEQIGFDRGKVDGKAEAARSLALKMLPEHISIATIARMTESLVEALQALQAENQPRSAT
jgi:hypothetical protein